MKNKVKVKKDKKLGRTNIDYYYLKDKKAFRFDILNTILKHEQIFLMINTNYCCSDDDSIPKENIRTLEQFLNNKGLRNIVVPIENTSKKKVFGIAVSKSKEPSYKLGVILPKNILDKEIYDNLFSIYDIEIGLGFLKSEDDILEDFRKNYFGSIFDKEYFNNAIFNGIKFHRIVTDLDIDENLIHRLTHKK
jgi:hypothetical protein